MVIDAVAKGATIEEAQQAAIKALGAPEEVDVRFEVVTFPEKKKFGIFGGKDAEVRAFYEVPDAPAPKPEKPKKSPAPKKQAAKKKPAPKPASPKKEEKKEEAVVSALKKQAPKNKPEPTEDTEHINVPEEDVREPIALEDCPEAVRRAYSYLAEIIEKIGITDAKINVFKNQKEFFFQVLSEQDYSLIIGRRGDTLDSIQYLVRLAANRGHKEEKSVHISINVGDYRQKRERTLREIARKNARRVRKFGRTVTLNPMNPSERRIIHTTVSDIEGVTSYSIGEESERRVVIALEEGVKPLVERNGGGYRGGRGNGNRGRNGGRGGYNRGNGGRRISSRPPRSAAPAAGKPENAPAPEKRAPHKDAEGVLYGKITPKAKPQTSVEEKPETTENTAE